MMRGLKPSRSVGLVDYSELVAPEPVAPVSMSPEMWRYAYDMMIWLLVLYTSRRASGLSQRGAVEVLSRFAPEFMASYIKAVITNGNGKGK